MTEKDISQEFRLKKMKKRYNCFIKEINQNELLSNKEKRDCMTLTCIEHFITLVFAVTVCISISVFVSLVDISKGIMSSTIRLNIFAIIARIKKHKSIIKKRKKRPDKKTLFSKTNLDCIIGSISRSLTDSYIEHNYFLLTDVLRKYAGMKGKSNKLETS